MPEILKSLVVNALTLRRARVDGIAAGRGVTGMIGRRTIRVLLQWVQRGLQGIAASVGYGGSERQQAPDGA